MKTNKRTAVGPQMIKWISGAILLAFCLLQPAAVKAQWTTPDGNGNINNTNTNNVGVGTTGPNYKFDITNALDRAQVRFGMGAGDSGGFLYSGAPAHATFSAGAAFNSGWIAKSLSASIIEHNLGQITFYTNPGISTGSPFTPTARMAITSGGNVGIGTTAPAFRLEVVDSAAAAIRAVRDNSATDSNVVSAGTIQLHNPNTTANNFTGISLQSVDSAGNIKPSSYIKSVVTARTTTGLSGDLAFAVNNGASIVEAMRLTSASNVGIGTMTPGYRLEVVGPGTWVAKFKRTDNSNGGIMIDSPAGFNPNLALATNGAVKWYLNSNASDGDKMQFWEASGTQVRFTFTQAGSLGLGITNPNYKLDVQGGSINSSGGLCIAGDCKTAWSQVGGSSQWTGSTALNFNGNVGVGMTTAPTRRLEVAGGNVFHQWSTTAGSEYGLYTAINNNHFTSNLYYDGQWKMITTGKGAVTAVAPVSGWAFSVFADNTSRAANAVSSPAQLFTVTMGGSVGVGTTSPGFDAGSFKYLTVDAGIGSIGSIGAAGATSNNQTVIGQLAFVNSILGTTEKRIAAILGATDNASNNGLIDFHTAIGGGFPAPRMRINSSGNVGIATINPTEKLEVVGNVKVSGTVEGGNIKAKYQDVAEWVESSQELEAGTVVVLDRSRSNQVVASTRSYDSRVAGVISLKPGITLGDAGEGRVLVATTGRVKVKVDATNVPIEIGDLLVSSDKEGFAMKSVPIDVGGVFIHRPGTLIGKALEPLSKGSGEILVLLSMQ